jgi:hypothetical protein
MAMSVWLLDEPWTDASFAVERSAGGRTVRDG